ncbi:hypothetical protein Tco_0491991 [Tanacetum coccineum]
MVLSSTYSTPPTSTPPTIQESLAKLADKIDKLELIVKRLTESTTNLHYNNQIFPQRHVRSFLSDMSLGKPYALIKRANHFALTRRFPSDMSPGKMCHRGPTSLTEK